MYIPENTCLQNLVLLMKLPGNLGGKNLSLEASLQTDIIALINSWDIILRSKHGRTLIILLGIVEFPGLLPLHFKVPGRGF